MMRQPASKQTSDNHRFERCIKMARKRVPQPRLRKGAKTYEVREKIAGAYRTKTLGTTDYDEALRLFPAVYAALVAEFESPATVPSTGLTVADVCRIRRDEMLASEDAFRDEHARGERQKVSYAPAKLADQYRVRLDRWLKEARSRWTVRDFDHQRAFLHRLKMSGAGAVDDEVGALRALAQTEIRTIKDIIASDDESGLPVALAAEPNGRVPKLSQYLEAYIKQQKALTPTRELDLRAAVRDFIASTEDKAVDAYSKEDTRAFREMITALPANYTKLKATRDMTAPEAADYARENDLKPMAVKTIQVKRAHLSRVFKFAAADYDDVFNPFADTTTWQLGVNTSAANQKVTFRPDELKAVFAASMSGDLYWLALLVLFTGARPNELLQMTGANVPLKPLPHLYINRDLALKTAARGELDGSVRSIPLHPRLIELGFLDLVKSRGSGRIFPDAKKRKLTGRYSAQAGTNFAYLLRKLGIKRDGLSLYSLRHTWAAEFKRRHPRDNEARERLMGHTVPGVAGRYGDDYDAEANDPALLETRAKLVEALRFDI